jgi:hypothetical protein
MQLRQSIETNHLISLIHELSLSEKRFIKNFLDNELADKGNPNEITLRELLLSGPVMDDQEYENYKEIKNQFDQWAKRLSL